MITHPEKLMFPDDGITKGELAGLTTKFIAPYVPHICGSARSRWRDTIAASVPTASSRKM